MKKINLVRALRKNKYCYGFIWRCSNGKYDYQNDNDLGLDVSELSRSAPLVKRVRLRRFGREYVYQLVGGYKDYGSGAPLKTVKALLLQCHGDELTRQEKNLCTRYWNRFRK